MGTRLITTSQPDSRQATPYSPPPPLRESPFRCRVAQVAQPRPGKNLTRVQPHVRDSVFQPFLFECSSIYFAALNEIITYACEGNLIITTTCSQYAFNTALFTCRESIYSQFLKSNPTPPTCETLSSTTVMANQFLFEIAIHPPRTNFCIHLPPP